MIQLGRYAVVRPDLDSPSPRYECLLCDRDFVSVRALEDHCRNTTRHAWCERCERVFQTDRHKEDHIENSSAHHICNWCIFPTDFTSWADLKDHRVTAHHWCDVCDIQYSRAQDLRVHDINCHTMCDECNQYFENDNNLRMHQRTHEPADLECYGCTRYFASFSRMLIHLEAGNCASGADVDTINRLAFECYQNRKYSTDIDDYYPYFCPGCDRTFRFVSGLFQHAEMTPSCSVFLQHPNCLAKLEHWIYLQV